jgi:hypothetical protein
MGISQQPNEVRIVCDGLSALQMAFGVMPILATTAQFDILKVIRRVRAALQNRGIRLIPVHVKGHADERQGHAEVSMDEQLNIRMDARAKEFWTKLNTEGWKHYKLRDGCSLTWNKSPVTAQELLKKIPEEELLNHWCEKKGLVNQDQADWGSFSKATRLIRRGKGVFMTKFFSGICGVNKWRKIWGLVDSDICPRCGVAVETTSHLWVCRATEASTLRQQHLDELIQWIRINGGNSRFCYSIRSVLGAISQQNIPNFNQIPEEYREIMAAQAVIGWDKFLMGLWSSQWIAKLKDEAEEQIRIFRRPQRAIAAIISKLWDIGWQLWLGRNAAIYPSEELTAEGELVQRTQIASSLCRKARRKRLDSQSRSREMMRRWIVRREPST